MPRIPARCFPNKPNTMCPSDSARSTGLLRRRRHRRAAAHFSQPYSDQALPRPSNTNQQAMERQVRETSRRHQRRRGRTCPRRGRRGSGMSRRPWSRHRPRFSGRLGKRRNFRRGCTPPTPTRRSSRHRRRHQPLGGRGPLRPDLEPGCQAPVSSPRSSPKPLRPAMRGSGTLHQPSRLQVAVLPRGLGQG